MVVSVPHMSRMQHVFYKSLLKIKKTIRPDLFRKHRPVVRSSKPRSMNHGLFSKQQIKKNVTCYNAGAHLYTNEYATDIRAFLFALQSEESYHAEYAQITSDDLLCILDSGCSIAISPDITDFPDGIEPINDLELKGIASGLAVTGVGMAHWTFLNEFNERVTVKIECLLVPEIPVRLLPPQQLSM
jgi:hypothetical protein